MDNEFKWSVVFPMCFFALSLSAVCFFCWFMISGDLKDRDKAFKDCDFQSGQMVKLRVDGRRGQITSIRWFRSELKIDVRLARPTARTNTHLIAPDDEIGFAGYSTVAFYPFELEHWDNDSIRQGDKTP